MEETWWRKPEDLDDDQKDVIALPLDGNHLVLGPPGCGKTNLLLLRASYLWRANTRDIVILTFTRMLKEFIAKGADNYPFPMEVIKTLRSWGGDILRSQDISYDAKAPFPKMWKSLIAGLSKLGEDIPEHLKHDCILLDESQDYTVEEIKVLSRFARQIFAVGDNDQRIYKSDGALAYLSTICSSPKPLRFHYRNGLKICRVADGIMATDGKMVDHCNYNEAAYPSTVERFSGLKLAAQVEQAIPALETQLRAYPGAYLGVMTYRRDDLQAIGALLAGSGLADQIQLQLYEEGYHSLDADRRIILTTTHSAKGLEFRGVHVLAANTLREAEAGNRLAFTATTRAKTSLAFYHDGGLPGYLERGIAASDDTPTPLPKLEDLFGGTK